MTHHSRRPPNPVDEDDLRPSESSYRIAPRVLFATAAMFALIFGCGGWAATAELAGAVISHGSVVVERHVKKIQHREGGIVAEIKVRNGDFVKSGDLLIRLDDTTTRAELGVLQSQLTELRGRLARLTAERDLVDHITFPPKFENEPGALAVIAGETKLFHSNLEGRRAQKQQHRIRIDQLQEETAGLVSQRDAKQVELDIIRQELDQLNELYDKRLVSVTRLFALQREQARIAGEHGNLGAQKARVAGQISEINLQILNVDVSTKTEAQRELRAIDARISEIIEREVAAIDRLTRVNIRAPQDGVVHELSAHTIGGVITPAEVIMLIVPNGEALSIEVKIPPINIEQIHLDQPVRLRFTAFNQRTTPEIQGAISYVSADISQDPKTRADFFTARVMLLEAKDWKLAGKQITPGMPVEAYITTEKRTALSYFIKPIVDQFSRAMREP